MRINIARTTERPEKAIGVLIQHKEFGVGIVSKQKGRFVPLWLEGPDGPYFGRPSSLVDCEALATGESVTLEQTP